MSQPVKTPAAKKAAPKPASEPAPAPDPDENARLFVSGSEVTSLSVIDQANVDVVGETFKILRARFLHHLSENRLVPDGDVMVEIRLTTHATSPKPAAVDGE